VARHPQRERMFYNTEMCMSGSETTPLETILRAIDRFVGEPDPELSPEELGEHLIRLRHGIDVFELKFATGAATFAATDEYDLQGSVTAIDWIRHHGKMSGHAAAWAVAAGEQAGRLHAAASALDAGDIGFAHFSLLARLARALVAKPAAAVPTPRWADSPRSLDSTTYLGTTARSELGRLPAKFCSNWCRSSAAPGSLRPPWSGCSSARRPRHRSPSRR
jgi:hypothetical protein